MAKDTIPEVLNTPCCLWCRAYVSYRDRAMLVRVGNTARTFYRWHYTIRAFPPDWHLYVSEEDLTKQEVEEMKQQRGPTIKLRGILREIIQR